MEKEKKGAKRCVMRVLLLDICSVIDLHVISSFPLLITPRYTYQIVNIFNTCDTILHKNLKPVQYVIAHDKIRGALRDADCSVTTDDETPPTTSRRVWREMSLFLSKERASTRNIVDNYQHHSCILFYSFRYVSLCACRKTD